MALNRLGSDIEGDKLSEWKGVIGKISDALHEHQLVAAILAAWVAQSACWGGGWNTAATPVNTPVDPFPTSFSVSSIVSNQDTNTLSFLWDCSDWDWLTPWSCKVWLTRNVPWAVPIYNNTVPSLGLNHEQWTINATTLSDWTSANTSIWPIMLHLRADVYNALINNNQFAFKDVLVIPPVLNLTVTWNWWNLRWDVFLVWVNYTQFSINGVKLDLSWSTDNWTIVNYKFTSDLWWVLPNLNSPIFNLSWAWKLNQIETITSELTDDKWLITTSTIKIFWD